MAPSGTNLRKLILGISQEEAAFLRRGFQIADSDAHLHLERIGVEFISGYMAALDGLPAHELAERLNWVDQEHRGFAFEGAAMALTLQDQLLPWSQRRFDPFLSGPGQPHAYMLHVGAGWACARLPWLRRRLAAFIQRFDPVLKWLVVDGFGFHEGYFQPRRSVEKHQTPFGLQGYAVRAFDQGLGRSLWFVCCADPTCIAATIAKFQPQRHGDLWSGVGLACAYAGGADENGIAALISSAGPYFPEFAQGVAFAAKARLRAGTQAAHTEHTCRIVCGLTDRIAAGICDETLQQLPSDGDEPAYESWRRRVQQQLTKSRVTNAT